MCVMFLNYISDEKIKTTRDPVTTHAQLFTIVKQLKSWSVPCASLI